MGSSENCYLLPFKGMSSYVGQCIQMPSSYLVYFLLSETKIQFLMFVSLSLCHHDTWCKDSQHCGITMKGYRSSLLKYRQSQNSKGWNVLVCKIL